MKVIAFINVYIIYFTGVIGNNIVWAKAKIKFHILKWKFKRDKISGDELIKAGNALTDEYRKWQSKNLEKLDNTVEKFFDQ